MNPLLDSLCHRAEVTRIQRYSEKGRFSSGIRYGKDTPVQLDCNATNNIKFGYSWKQNQLEFGGDTTISAALLLLHSSSIGAGLDASEHGQGWQESVWLRMKTAGLANSHQDMSGCTVYTVECILGMFSASFALLKYKCSATKGRLQKTESTDRLSSSKFDSVTLMLLSVAIYSIPEPEEASCALRAADWDVCGLAVTGCSGQPWEDPLGEAGRATTTKGALCNPLQRPITEHSPVPAGQELLQLLCRALPRGWHNLADWLKLHQIGRSVLNYKSVTGVGVKMIYPQKVLFACQMYGAVGVADRELQHGRKKRFVDFDFLYDVLSAHVVDAKAPGPNSAAELGACFSLLGNKLQVVSIITDCYLKVNPPKNILLSVFMLFQLICFQSFSGFISELSGKPLVKVQVLQYKMHNRCKKGLQFRALMKAVFTLGKILDILLKLQTEPTAYVEYVYCRPEEILKRLQLSVRAVCDTRIVYEAGRNIFPSCLRLPKFRLNTATCGFMVPSWRNRRYRGPAPLPVISTDGVRNERILNIKQRKLTKLLHGILNAKEVIWRLVSADKIVVIARCFPSGLPWDGQGGGHPWQGGDHPWLIRNRYSSAGFISIRNLSALGLIAAVITFEHPSYGMGFQAVCFTSSAKPGSCQACYGCGRAYYLPAATIVVVLKARLNPPRVGGCPHPAEAIFQQLAVSSQGMDAGGVLQEKPRFLANIQCQPQEQGFLANIQCQHWMKRRWLQDVSRALSCGSLTTSKRKCQFVLK
ncbi:hypothetical protein Anapl_13700 [Anas platyrhynchos]|uniref:Uncharacterized protein n=1 Tax=Anas platyrhynchos TaxID=8839 RepID=R0JPI9_ANAPL|nr:hypothetical protein Anapl_13700 [Anas platyrhynchos]